MSEDPNLDRLERTLKELGSLADDLCLVGGCTAGLLITDEGAAPVRPTVDVDLIIEVVHYAQYQKQVVTQMKARGFEEGQAEGDPICRWRKADLVVDIMPVTDGVLGPTNRWYASAMKHKKTATLPGGTTAHHIDAPHFLATKLQAFEGRGAGDFAGSHDMEDVMRVIDGRPTIVEEVRNAPEDLRLYVRTMLREAKGAPYFLEAMPEYFQGDEERVPIVTARLNEILETSR